LLAGQRLLGVLSVGGTQRPYTNEEREVFHAIANQVAVALTNVRLLEENGRRAERLATLAAVSRAISAVTDPGDLYGTTDRACRPLFPRANSPIGRIEPETGAIIAESYIMDGVPARHMEGTALIGGLGPLVRDTGKPVMTNDYAGELVRRG